MLMKEPNRILFVSQKIYPYLAEETAVNLLNRKLPEFFQANGYETRTFMPKFGDINERRNQLHEVIRLSGMNIIIEDTDHPVIIKVASIQAARIQIYFIDNDDYFHRRKGTADENGDEYKDNDERCIFYARGVLDTVHKLRWTPSVIHCSGWMSARLKRRSPSSATRKWSSPSTTMSTRHPSPPSSPRNCLWTAYDPTTCEALPDSLSDMRNLCASRWTTQTLSSSPPQPSTSAYLTMPKQAANRC